MLFCSFAQEEPALRSATESAEGVAQNGQESESFDDSEISLNKENGTYDSQETESLDRLERGGDLPHLYTYVDSTVVEQRQVYTGEQIEKMHVQDLPSLFSAAGIQILSYGAYGLEQKPSIRGFTDETVRVVIDGICVNNPQYGTFDFTSLNPRDIERIEIVRGGFTEGVSDDGAVAGVIYITTKKQSLGHQFNTDTQIKSFFYAQRLIDGFSQNFGYNGQISENDFIKTNLKATYAQNEFPFLNYRKLIKIRSNSQVYDAHSNISYSHYFGEGNSFTVKNLTYAGYKHTPGTATANQNGIQQDYNNILGFNINFPSIAKCVTWNSNLNWICNNRFFDQYNEHSKHFINTISFATSADLFCFKKYKQSAGISLDYVHLDSTDDGQHDQFSGTFKETSKFLFNKHFSLIVPLSIKFCGENVAFTPKIGFKAAFKYCDLSISGYRMVQFPNMDDLYWNGGGNHGNPDLLPETGWGAEFTTNFHNIFIPFSFCVFTNYYSNKIQWSNLNNTWSPQNISSAFYLGFDLSFEKTLFKFWTIRSNWEYLYNALLNQNDKNTYLKRIMWTPDLVFSVINSFNFKYGSVSIEVNYTGKKYISNLNISYVEPYCLVNLCGELDLWKHFQPYLRIDNLFNVDYEAIPDYPMPGISLIIGCKCKW